MKRILAGGSGLLLAVLVAAPAGAQMKHVDYSGVWLMDVAKSQMDGQGMPSASTWTILQHGDSIITDRETESADAVGPIKSHVVVTLDGKATSNTVPANGTLMATSSTASWDSTGVVIRTTGNTQGYDFVLTDHWTLGADGKTMVSDRTITVGDQVVQTSKLVFNRKT